jgi:hypothetical protein
MDDIVALGLETKFKYMLNVAEQNSVKLTERELDLHSQIYDELLQNEYFPGHAVVSKTEFEFACALAQLDRLSEGMENALSPKAKFLVTYVNLLDQICRLHYTRQSHATEFTQLYATKN